MKNIVWMMLFFNIVVVVAMQGGKSHIHSERDESGYDADSDNDDSDPVGLLLKINNYDGSPKELQEDTFDCCDQVAQYIAKGAWLLTFPCRGYRAPVQYPPFAHMSKRDVLDFFLCRYSQDKKRI